MVQRPTNLDTTCSLALLQEEVAEGECISPPRQLDHKYITFPRRASTVNAPSAAPTLTTSQAVDNRGMVAATQTGTSRLNALHNYRKAKGLSFKYGERWGQNTPVDRRSSSTLWKNCWSYFHRRNSLAVKHQIPVQKRQRQLAPYLFTL
jgi:hypothetical protein